MVKPFKVNLNLFYVFFLFLSTAILAQNTQRYNGDYAIKNFSGEASYEYKLIEGDTILNGIFRFRDKGLKSLEKKAYSSFLVEGSLKNNKPQGAWRLSFGDYQRSKEPRLVDYSYVIDINGIQKSVNGFFNNGIADKEFILKIDSIENSKITKNLFKSTISYQNGIPQKNFTIETGMHSLIGRLLRDGLAHDKWTLFENEKLDETENWIFKDGLLEKVVVSDNGLNKTIGIFESDYKKLAEVPLDKRFLKILSLKLPAHDTSRIFEKGIGKLLRKNLREYTKLQEFINYIGDSITIPNFKVKVPLFPISEVNTLKLKTIADSIRKAELLSKNILDNPQLNIQKFSDEETEFLYEVSKKLTTDYLASLALLRSFSEENLIIHFDQQKLLKKLWPNGLPDDEIKVEIQDKAPKTYQAKGALSYKRQPINLVSIEELTNFTLLNLSVLHKKLVGKISVQERQEAFLLQEEALIEESGHLKKLIDSIKGTAPKNIQSTLESLKGFADEQLNSYASMKENPSKLEYAKKLTNCFTKTENLAIYIANLPQQQKEIKKLYQDQVWNPFTATVMDEDVKKRITKAYGDILIPEQLERIREDLSCETIEPTQNFLEALHERMIEMREEDTTRLNRKLKKEKNPEEIKLLFGLNSKEIEE
ncbi:hypothetical protein HX109_00880 [Galbibacter sp. BG1]|uniref:hypothetical protein n=1 Tax=Galbibacter sp. BG1 TaxID=1170699 RepID=UPI0015B882CC|nr:hypothetical protein [Galbibacter sp. BG1]QLE00183.1 hypothetical protein HX109_00880 [Galbibacter sp. BG1]